jgi:16S rRNA U1498 N3-methylase RsmE
MTGTPSFQSQQPDQENRSEDTIKELEQVSVSLLLALPQLLQLRWIVPMVCQLGLNHIFLTNACKVPKDNFGLSLFPRLETLRGLLIEELAISRDMLLLEVVVTRKLRAFLEDKLDNVFPHREVARVIAHPSQVDILGGGDGTDKDDDVGGGGGSNKQQTSNRIFDVVFLNNHGGPQRILVAVGPKGRWEKPSELDMFKRMGFQRVLLGSRVLCSNAAVVSLLVLANEACALDSTPLQPKISSPGTTKDGLEKSSKHQPLN